MDDFERVLYLANEIYRCEKEEHRQLDSRSSLTDFTRQLSPDRISLARVDAAFPTGARGERQASIDGAHAPDTNRIFWITFRVRYFLNNRDKTLLTFR